MVALDFGIWTMGCHPPFSLTSQTAASNSRESGGRTNVSLWRPHDTSSMSGAKRARVLSNLKRRSLCRGVVPQRELLGEPESPVESEQQAIRARLMS